MSSSGSDRQLTQQAKAAAGIRMGQCRARVAELAEGRCDASDVQRARQRLALARERAAAAELRLLAVREQYLRMQFPRRAPVVAVIDRSGLRRTALAHPLSLLWDCYVAVGGTFAEVEVDAYVNGLADLPPIEEAALHQAVWELDRF